MPKARATLAFVAAVALAGCFSPNVPNGKLHCSSDGKCPSGFHCASDRTCWKNGQDPSPPDMSGGSTVGGGHAGAAHVVGGVSAKSENYKIVTTTGQAPGGNGKASSASFTSKGGVVGATQNK